MGKAKNETVAKYHREHFNTYSLNFRRDEDADLLEFIDNSEVPVSEIFRQAFRLYMGSEVQK